MTPTQYWTRVVQLSPGLMTLMWLEQEVLKQWTNVTPVSHPALYMAIGVPTAMLYLDNTLNLR